MYNNSRLSHNQAITQDRLSSRGRISDRESQPLKSYRSYQDFANEILDNPELSGKSMQGHANSAPQKDLPFENKRSESAPRFTGDSFNRATRENDQFTFGFEDPSHYSLFQSERKQQHPSRFRERVPLNYQDLKAFNPSHLNTESGQFNTNPPSGGGGGDWLKYSPLSVNDPVKVIVYKANRESAQPFKSPYPNYTDATQSSYEESFPLEDHLELYENPFKDYKYNWRRKHSLATEPTAHVSPLVNSALRNPKRTDRHVFPVKTATATDFLTPEKTRLDPYKAALHDLNRYNQSLFPNNSSQKEKWQKEIDDRINALHQGRTVRPDSFEIPPKTQENNTEKVMNPLPIYRFDPKTRSLSGPRSNEVRVPARSNAPSHTSALRQSNFLDKNRTQQPQSMPIYRVNPVGLLRNSHSNRIHNSSVEVISINDSPPRVNPSQDHCPNCHSRVETVRFYPQSVSSRRNSADIGQRAATPLQHKQEPGKLWQSQQLSQSIDLLKASHSDFPSFDSCHKPGDFYRRTDPHEIFSTGTGKHYGPNNNYPIARSHNLDYPYLILQGEKKDGPRRSIEVYTEKKRKKGDQIDPFLEVLAKTYVVDDEGVKNRRKSKAMLKLENYIRQNSNSNSDRQVVGGVDQSTVSWPETHKSGTDAGETVLKSGKSEHEGGELPKTSTFLESARNDLPQRLEASEAKKRPKVPTLGSLGNITPTNKVQLDDSRAEKPQQFQSGSSQENVELSFTTPVGSDGTK